MNSNSKCNGERMTRNQVIRLAALANLTGLEQSGILENFERFAELVAAAEREECAKECEAIYNDPEENNGYDAYYTRPYLECAEAIRARAKK
jgi:hypothetical protein